MKRIRHTNQIANLRDALRMLEIEKEKLKSVHTPQMIDIRQNTIKRLKRDLELWERGVLGFEFNVPIHRVYWQLLGPSDNSWEEIIRHFEYLSKIRNEKYEIERLKFVHDFKPDEIYIGLSSFEGYVVFCFRRGQTAALECPKVGNAMYFMKLDEWMFLSHLSKMELLQGHNEKIARVIHSEDWQPEVRRQLSRRGVF